MDAVRDDEDNPGTIRVAAHQWFGQPFMPPVLKLAAKLKSDGFVDKGKGI